jgi:hypothetical protein
MSDPDATGTVDEVKIRVVLDRLDPPEGRLQMTPRGFCAEQRP